MIRDNEWNETENRPFLWNTTGEMDHLVGQKVEAEWVYPVWRIKEKRKNKVKYWAMPTTQIVTKVPDEKVL